MIDVAFSILQGAPTADIQNPSRDLVMLPVHQFKWWILLYFLALHGIIAAIATELMGRTYGKWWLWFLVAFCFPLVGPVSIFLYHLIISSTVTDARKRTIWDRFFSTHPVSLYKAHLRDQARSEPPKLHNFSINPDLNNKPDRDAIIEAHLIKEEFDLARAHAWKMMEIARDSADSDQIERYQKYLEIIAEKQVISNGNEINSH
ncbi:MAG TPA: hypothetical protein ENN67_03740 [Firmicutes bacterium]|nr:hypothetical protein [Bacillota bacterium]